MAQRPMAIGLLVCEQVIVEEKTGNITPVNCFSHRTFSQFPSDLLSFVVLAFLTDGSGEMELEVVIDRLDINEYVYRRSHRYFFTSPLTQVRCIIRIRDWSFPVAGHYEISIRADHEIVAQRRIIAIQES